MRATQPIHSLIAALLLSAGCNQSWEDEKPDANTTESPLVDGGARVDNRPVDASPGPLDATPESDGDLVTPIDGSVEDAPNKPVVTCEPNPCANGGTCSVINGTPTCSCASGFAGSSCESDVNECTGNHGCNPRFPCHNFPGGYSCLGQTADWPISKRSGTGGTPQQQGWIIDTDKQTALDKITGLMWQRKYSAGFVDSYAGARAFCQNATTGGFNDWRVPSMIEAATLLTTERVPDYSLWFSESLPQAIWTNTYTAASQTMILDVRTPYRYGLDDHDIKNMSVQCVRTAEVVVSGTPAQRYEVKAAEDEVYDRRTKLTWRRTPEHAQVTYAQADSYCKGLGKQYRLPTMAELISLFDMETVKLASVFNTIKSNDREVVYWSTTTPMGQPASHVYVNSEILWWWWGANGDGTADPANQGLPEWYARCVHNGAP